MVERMEGGLRFSAGEPDQEPVDDLSGRVAHPERRRPWLAVSHDADNLPYVVETRLGAGRIGGVVCDAGNQDAVEKALQHRRGPETPRRKLNDQRLGGFQSPHIAFQPLLVARTFEIMASFVRGKDSREGLCVEIQEIDRMSFGLESVQRRGPNAGMKAVRKRVAIEIENP